MPFAPQCKGLANFCCERNFYRQGRKDREGIAQQRHREAFAQLRGDRGPFATKNS